MEKPGFLIQHFMIAGLLAAIGIVVLAGQSYAGNRYCTYYPEDPNCYEALYGQRDVSQAPGDDDGQFEDGDFIFSHLHHARGPNLSRRAKALAGRCGNMAIARCARWIAAASITSMWPISATSATCFG